LKGKPMASSTTVEWFGERGDMPVYDIAPKCPVPVGDRCVHCPDPILEDDSGFTLPYVGGLPAERVSYHRDCFREHILGGLTELGGTR
jgi:hypothetical protein